MPHRFTFHLPFDRSERRCQTGLQWRRRRNLQQLSLIRSLTSLRSTKLLQTSSRWRSFVRNLPYRRDPKRSTLPSTYHLENLKQDRAILQYLQHYRIWLTQHKFQCTKIASVGFIFMKSLSMTHAPEYLKSLKKHLLCHDYLKWNAQEDMDSSDDEATTTVSNKASTSNNWQSLEDVPHMELMRRSLIIWPPPHDPDTKTLPVSVLELKCDQEHLHTIREAIVQSKIPVRTFGILFLHPFLQRNTLRYITQMLDTFSFSPNSKWSLFQGFMLHSLI